MKPPSFARHAARRPSRRAVPIGCGVDVVKLSRLRQALGRHGAAFLDRVFTKGEQAYARARRRTMLLHLAGRFAAKEAVIKAVSQLEPKRMLAMKDIEVRNDRLGRPHIVLHDRRPRRADVSIYISLSHVDTVAVATAIAMR